MDGLLKTALIFLGAAVVFVPIAKKTGLGSVLGYLIAGIIIGPFMLGLVGEEGEDIMHVAEFGVVMMLFIIGLEIDPKELLKMRRTIVGLGLMQMGITTVLIGAFCHFFFGAGYAVSLAIGLALSMSSTAIVLQTLKEKGLTATTGGVASFSVLLFQDIMVIPILAILPVLSTQLPGTGPEVSLIESYPGWMQTILVLGAVGLVFLSGRFIVVPLLRFISKTRLREMFTASALLVVVGVATLMEAVGLSPALGTFLAGVVLANTEFRHELESDIEPFKGLLLGLFFMGVGATINFKLVVNDPLTIFSMVLALIAVKGITLFIAGKFFRIRNDQNIFFSVLLSQVGEFAFVLLTFSNKLMIIDQQWTDTLMAITAISMTVTPVLLIINERLIDPYMGVREQTDEKHHDEIHEKNSVILAGFGHFGSTIGRFLRANGIEATILDNDSDRVELLRKMGFKVYYGDATRIDLLRSAGAETACMLIAAIDSPETNKDLIHNVKKHFPNMEVLARARNRFDAYDLIDMGVKNIYRETLYTSVHMAIDVLRKLGFRGYTATRKGMEFIHYDESALSRLATHRHEMKEYIINIREEIEQQEKLLSDDLHINLTAADHAWDSEVMRKG